MTPNLIENAIARIATPVCADQAREVIYRMAAGWKVREVGDYLGLTWRQVNDLRELVGQELIGALRADGYSEVEVIRLLGVATGIVESDAGSETQ